MTIVSAIDGSRCSEWALDWRPLVPVNVGADLIAVESRSGPVPEDYLLGNVADTGVKYSHCSVLIYRR